MLPKIKFFAKIAILGALIGVLVGLSKNFVIPQTRTINGEINKPVNLSPVSAEPTYHSVIRLESVFGFFCSAVVIDENYAMTAAHCVTTGLGEIDTGNIHIFDVHGFYTNVVAKAVAVDNLRDVAFIKGDFRHFGYAKVDFKGNQVKYGMVMRACGFPSGEALYCTNLIHVGNYFFQYRTIGGPIFKGMSGGPVYDILTNQIVGVNSAVTEGHVIISPLIGVLSNVGLE